ncbi:MAG: hypothetical protein CJBNEKGG_04349 [Prosthecobacter sp.]|nr:hypothetical protein [Prosthecobacter sp.]
MLSLKPLLPPLVVLLLVSVATLRRAEGAEVPLKSEALGRLGCGLGKICLLVLPLEWLMHLVLHGEPQAVSGKAWWLAAMTQTCQLFLLITGVADVVAGLAGLKGRRVQEMHHAPGRAGGFADLWRRLMPGLVSGGGAAVQCVPVLVLVAGTAALWHGTITGASVWFVLHYLLLMLEGSRRRPLLSPLPPPLRVIGVLLILTVSNVLLFSAGLQEALHEWRLMFTDSRPTVYSLLLDKRITSSWLQSVLALAILTCVALPRLGWLLGLPLLTWRVIGILLLPVSLLMAVRESIRIPAPVRAAAQWPVSWFWGEGSSRVHLGYDGWLFPRHELDRRTLRRKDAGLAGSITSLAAELKARGIPLMLVAVPAKLAMHPDQMLRAEYPAAVQPPGFREVLDSLTRAGVDVMDLAPALWGRLVKAPSHYAADSHWTFETMKEAAGLVARRIREKHPALHMEETPLINATILERSTPGDLAVQLLPFGAEKMFGLEHAQLVSIRGLEPDKGSPVLLAGGGLLRVFEDASASFGLNDGVDQHAGFPTQLAALLGRPLDVRTDLEPASITQAAAGKKLVVLVVGADQL